MERATKPMTQEERAELRARLGFKRGVRVPAHMELIPRLLDDLDDADDAIAAVAVKICDMLEAATPVAVEAAKPDHDQVSADELPVVAPKPKPKRKRATRGGKK